MDDAILAFFRKAIDAAGKWSEGHGWAHSAADLAGCFGCLFSFVVLAWFLRRRSPVPYARFYWTLAALVLAAGIVHLLHGLNAYRLMNFGAIATALAALAVASVSIATFPKVLALRSPAEFQREIAQRRRTELELRQVHAQLEGVIEQRTAELAAKNEEMEQFLNTVSHDLKSPVVTCVGLTGMLRESLKSGSTEEAQDTVNRIDRSVNRMKQLIDNLLNLSRIGKVRFELADVDTMQMMTAIGDELKPRLEKIGAVLQIEGDLPHVSADAHWLTEVFENLINNALKYGCDNPHPSIAVGSIDKDGEHRFYVRDNGSGIDPAHHAQIFEPFRRLRTDKEGSGMGLAIVARIIKMHRGRVWVESETGKGATFWIALPARVALESIDAVPARA